LAAAELHVCRAGLSPEVRGKMWCRRKKERFKRIRKILHYEAVPALMDSYVYEET